MKLGKVCDISLENLLEFSITVDGSYDINGLEQKADVLDKLV